MHRLHIYDRRGDANLPPHTRALRRSSYMVVSSSFLTDYARITQLYLQLRPKGFRWHFYWNWIAISAHGLACGERLSIMYHVTTSACCETLLDDKFATECLLDDDGLGVDGGSAVGSSHVASHGAASLPKWRRISWRSNLFRTIIASEQTFSPKRRAAVTTSLSVKRFIVRYWRTLNHFRRLRAKPSSNRDSPF